MNGIRAGFVALLLGGGFTATGASAGPIVVNNGTLTTAIRAAFVRPAPILRRHYARAVWFRVMNQRLQRYIPQSKRRRHLLLLVWAEASRAGISPSLILAVINVESNFNSWAVSATGAQGLMQIMPFWLKKAGKPGDNLFNPETNLRLGSTILAWYLKRARGNIPLALQSYYGKRYGDYYAERVLRLLSTRWNWR